MKNLDMGDWIGANAKPFVTHFNALDCDYFLRIAIANLPPRKMMGISRVLGAPFRGIENTRRFDAARYRNSRMSGKSPARQHADNSLV